MRAGIGEIVVDVKRALSAWLKALKGDRSEKQVCDASDDRQGD